MPPNANRAVDLLKALAASDEPLPHSVLYRAQSAGQGIDGRVTLRLLDRDRMLPDSKPVSVWCGVPGVSAKIPNGSELALGFFRGDPTQPFAMLATPYGAPTHVPDEVVHDARTLISMLASAESTLAKMKVGQAPTFAVALAPQTIAALGALQTAIAAVGVYAAAVAVVSPTTLPASTALATAISSLASALAPLLGSSPAGLSSLKLEAQ